MGDLAFAYRLSSSSYQKAYKDIQTIKIFTAWFSHIVSIKNYTKNEFNLGYFDIITTLFYVLILTTAKLKGKVIV